MVQEKDITEFEKLKATLTRFKEHTNSSEAKVQEFTLAENKERETQIRVMGHIDQTLKEYPYQGDVSKLDDAIDLLINFVNHRTPNFVDGQYDKAVKLLKKHKKRLGMQDGMPSRLYLVYNNELKSIKNNKISYNQVPKRRITPGELFVFDGLTLKSYFMQEKGQNNPTKLDLFSTKDFLEEMIQKEELATHSGQGFLILSKGILNVCRWSEDPRTEDVSIPQIYTLEDSLWVPQRVGKVGVFCNGEERVHHHESGTRVKYLNSSRTPKDLKKYHKNSLNEHRYK